MSVHHKDYNDGKCSALPPAGWLVKDHQTFAWKQKSQKEGLGLVERKPGSPASAFSLIPEALCPRLEGKEIGN